MKYIEKAYKLQTQIEVNFWVATEVRIDPIRGIARVVMTGWKDLQAYKDGAPNIPDAQLICRINDVKELESFDPAFNDIVGKLLTDEKSNFYSGVLRDTDLEA